MDKVEAVIFDWSGTLVHDPPLRDRVASTFATLGRPDIGEVDEVCAALLRCESDPDIVAAQASADTSRASYNAAESLRFERAGLDGELATCLLRFDENIESRPLYPDVVPTLEQLKFYGCRIVVLSDIHFDIRPLLTAQGAGQYIDDYVLSYEHRVQKPDAQIFELALEKAGSDRKRTLMVGDRSTHDGAANELGITTLLLPPLRSFGPRGLSLVSALAA
ncbi:HAD-IA family hydrolase [Arthrobacter tecti]